MSDTGNTCQGCGTPHTPGTLFCTSCGLPVARASSGAGSPDTQTLVAPGKKPPAGNTAPGGNPQWRPGQDWNPGAGWQQEQQGFNQQGPDQQQYGLPATGPQEYRAQEYRPQGTGPQGSTGTGVPSGGRQRPSRLPLIAVTIAAAALLGSAAGAYVLIARPFSSSPGTASGGTNVANVSQSASGSSSVTPGSATGPTAPAQPSPTQSAPTAPSSQNGSGQQAATALAGLLRQSSSDRSAINNAYNDAYGCGGNLAADQQTFKQAASSRQYLLNQLASLPGAQTLPTQMLSDLTNAWQASLSVDNDYAQWAGDENSSGCTLQDPSYAAAETPNEQATADKNAFVGRWNPIAAQYSLPQYSGEQI
jgi:hypothetical protein